MLDQPLGGVQNAYSLNECVEPTCDLLITLAKNNPRNNPLSHSRLWGCDAFLEIRGELARSVRSALQRTALRLRSISCRQTSRDSSCKGTSVRRLRGC